tara:strand:- start:216 stop:518 length:303 start_codon:yes stop_codon:yes gene_type:complete
MDNAEFTKAVGSDNFKLWSREVVKHFSAPFDYNFDSTFTDDLIKINYKDELDQCGNPKAILICNYMKESNLWFIDYDTSFIDLEPYEILSFNDMKEIEKC